MKQAKALNVLAAESHDETQAHASHRERVEDYDISPIVSQRGERYFRLRRHRLASLVCHLKLIVRRILSRKRHSLLR